MGWVYLHCLNYSKYNDPWVWKDIAVASSHSNASRELFGIEILHEAATEEP